MVKFLALADQHIHSELMAISVEYLSFNANHILSKPSNLALLSLLGKELLEEIFKFILPCKTQTDSVTDLFENRFYGSNFSEKTFTQFKRATIVVNGAGSDEVNGQYYSF